MYKVLYLKNKKKKITKIKILLKNILIFDMIH